MSYAVIVREAASGSREEQMQRPIARHDVEKSKWEVSTKSLRAWGSPPKKMLKVCGGGDGGDDDMLLNSIR